MKIYYGSKELKLSNTAVALGDFDALHIGHKAIITDMLDYAKGMGCLSVVYMFSSHPNKAVRGVNTLSQRFEFLEKMGVECCVVEEFTPEYKNTSCEDFVEEYLKNRLGARGVFVGFNYRFGRMAQGDTEKLKELFKEGEVFVKPCIELDGVAVSSTLIRKLLEKGNVRETAKFLKRPFMISGKVVRGKQIGRTIGFPTANLEYPNEKVVLKSGVYITKAIVSGESYYSVTNVGEKPTVEDENKNIEVAIGNFSQDIYGEEIQLEFYDYLRDIEKFKSLDALKVQLEKDIMASEKYFKKGEKI